MEGEWLTLTAARVEGSLHHVAQELRSAIACECQEEPIGILQDLVTVKPVPKEDIFRVGLAFNLPGT